MRSRGSATWCIVDDIFKPLKSAHDAAVGIVSVECSFRDVVQCVVDEL
jgi:hypothetical protein